VSERRRRRRERPRRTTDAERRPPAATAPPRAQTPRAVFQPGAWLTFLAGVLLGMFAATTLAPGALDMLQLVIYFAVALLVALLWRRWARRRVAERRARHGGRGS
jgi:hypothetical protein